MSEPSPTLRITAEVNGWPKAPDVLEANALAHRIAQSIARSDIECLTLWVDTPDGRWYMTELPAVGSDGHDPADAEFVATAVRYLELTGQLIRREGHPTHVRFKELTP